MERLRDLIILLLLLLASRFILYEVTGYTADDAFITYRYAENLANGEGFVFNQGERVQGTSSPLYTLILATVSTGLKSSAIPVASRLISALADFISLIVLWHLLSSFSSLARFLASALFTLYPKVVLIGISGMEASLLVMMMLLSLYLYRVGRPDGALLILGLLLLCRIDSIVWVLIFVISGIAAKIRFSLVAAFVAVIISTSWMVFSSLYFGVWLPHTVVAKSISWEHLFPAFDPLRVLLGYFPFQGLQGYPLGMQLGVVVIFLIPVIPGLIHTLRHKDILAIFPVFFVIYNLAFSFGKVVMADRYYLPGYVAYFVTLGYLADWLQMKRGMFSRGFFAEGLLKLSLAAVLLVLLGVGATRWAESPGGLFLRQNKQLGIWLKGHASPDAHVFLEPIGYVGWESKLHIDDYIGLVSPAVLSYRKRFPNSDAWFIEYLKKRQPEYVVFRNWEIPRNALFHGHGDGLFQNQQERNWFHASYMETNWNPRAAIEDSVYLVLYERVSQVSGVIGKEQ